MWYIKIIYNIIILLLTSNEIKFEVKKYLILLFNQFMEKCLNYELLQRKRLFEGIAHSTESDPNCKKLIEFISQINLTNENILLMMNSKYYNGRRQGKLLDEKKSKYFNLLKHINKWIKQQIVGRKKWLVY